MEQRGESGHTPGPWNVRQCDGDYRRCDTEDYAVVSDGLITPALVFGGPGFWPEGSANAHLIAAAPELLSALRECVWLLADLQTEPGLVQKKAIAAIAKATDKSDAPGTANEKPTSDQGDE
jgi:hypothetical protein